MGLPFVLITCLIFIPERYFKFIKYLLHGLVWSFLIVFATIFSSELVSYAEWRSKLSSKIFVHFETPSEIFRTSAGSNTGWFIFYLFLQILIFYGLYKWLILKERPVRNKISIGKKIINSLSFLGIGASLITLGLRGGIQEIPISATNAYYSNNQIVNDLSVNSVWNFIHMSYQHYKKDIENMFNKMDKYKALAISENLYDFPNIDTVRVLKSDRPNIIFVTLESWSAELVGALGSEEGITPNFDQLCSEGILFTNIYATSTTSETGHTSIFSGYPTLPGISISSESAKCRQLPSIFQSLKAYDYNSSYYFGGALAYGNIGGYLTEMGVDKLVDENDLDLEPKGKLGIHDEAMFKYFFKEIDKAKRPYIYGLFTQSTHAPYDMPEEPVEGYPENSIGYVTSLVYADKQIKKFTELLKTLPDFNNTLVIFVADHGKTHYKNNNIFSAEFYHIPLLFWGGALSSEYKGSEINKIGSQSDIATTILTQLNINTDDFNWSKNLLNPMVKEWALLTTTRSFGLIDTSGYTSYNTIQNSIINSSYDSEDKTKQALIKSRGLVESIYEEFRNF